MSSELTRIDTKVLPMKWTPLLPSWPATKMRSIINISAFFNYTMIILFQQSKDEIFHHFQTHFTFTGIVFMNRLSIFSICLNENMTTVSISVVDSLE